jgi:hypothetical protein
LALLGVLGAVFLLNCRPEVSRQRWSEQWGPIVPHKTFPTDCGLCHTTEGWDVVKDDFSFDHSAETGYVLEGAHADATCLRCHNDRGPVSFYVARGCGGCHPDPHASALGQNCERCHEQRNWRPTGSIADHARTGFHLVAAHAVAPCESCHLQAAIGQFRGAPRQCELCHQANLATATSPDHIANGWTTNCERCHTPAGWGAADFVHTFFPLTGGHAGLDCMACHTGGTIGPIPSGCYSCHSDDYQAAPNHAAQSFSTNCEQCHSPAGWTGAAYMHTSFPLSGGHGGLDCTACHTSGTVGPIPSDCYSCHSDDYQTAPDHVSLGFPTNCEQCHSPAAWQPASFVHTFPLQGHHDVACSICHNTGSTATFSCFSCHDQTRTDNHHDEVGGYVYDSQACYQCHPQGRH